MMFFENIRICYYSLGGLIYKVFGGLLLLRGTYTKPQHLLSSFNY